MTTGWTIAGTDMRTLAFEIQNVDGWDGWPGKRGSGIEIPYRHGAITTPKKFYQPREFALAVVVLATDAAGAVTHPEGDLGHIRENTDILMGLLHSDSLIAVAQTVPDPGGGTIVRTALCEVLDVIPVSTHIGITRSMLIRFKAPDPFWAGPLVNDNANVGAFTVSPGGNAPVADYVLVFKAGTTQRLTWDTPATYLEVVGAAPAAGWEIDAGARTVTNLTTGLPVDNLLSRSVDWPEFAPAVSNGMTLAGGGTVDIAYKPKWF